MTTDNGCGPTIAAAFVKAQAAFGPALKGKKNPFFDSKYADLASCVAAVSESLHANGIAFTQQTFTDETGVTVQTVLIHESGEQLCSGRLHVPAVKNDAQAYGSALTYARRYSLMAICGIAPEDDDGNAATSAKAPSKAKTAVKKPQKPDAFDAIKKRIGTMSDTAKSLANQLRTAAGQKQFDSIMAEANGVHSRGGLTEDELNALDEYAQLRLGIKGN